MKEHAALSTVSVDPKLQTWNRFVGYVVWVVRVTVVSPANTQVT